MHRTLAASATLALSSLLLAAPALAQSDSGVEVTDPGDEPRTELRYAWSEGLTSTVVLVEEGTLTTTVNEVPVSEDAVGATTTITRTVTEVGEDGSARIEFSVAGDEPGGLGLPAADMFSEEAIDDLQTELADLSSYSGWMEVDARGVLLDFSVDGLDQDLAELLISTRGLGAELPVLPEEAVGVGATCE